MKIQDYLISSHNEELAGNHSEQFDFLKYQLDKKGIDVESIIDRLTDFQVAIPSWALGAGGTRFGRFSYGGEPGNLEQKIDDVGIIHALTKSAGAISLHIPWDIPKDANAIKEQAKSLGIIFDAVNSNTFQDQQNATFSFKFGSLCHIDKSVRQQAIDHNIEVIEYGKALGSKSITVWLADGSTFPGQHNFRTAFQNTQKSLHEIYQQLPEDWRMFIEYKPFEPNFYSMAVPDWGTSLLLAEACGDKAFTLVDLGHHLPNTNIEQIVAILMLKGKLGGFHFNDSKYGDDDLTCGSIHPYQLFLIFNELVFGMENNVSGNPPLAWMIDASHNVKDPLEDLMQSLEAINLAYGKALLVDQKALEAAQFENDVTISQEVLQNAFRTDVRPILRETRLRNGAAIDPLVLYRKLKIRESLIKERGKNSIASGL